MGRAFAMAMGLYTALPGFARWDEESQGLLALMLPPVGLVLGLLWWGIAALCRAVMPGLLASAAIALAMPLLTGFLHLDGFMDVADALLSRRPREEKLRILKDPHTGAFAVIALLCLLLVMAGAADALPRPGVPLAALVFLPVISRLCAALALMSVPPLGESFYGKLYYDSATPGRRLYSAIALAAVLGLCFALAGWRAGVAGVLATVGGLLACWRAVTSLGGLNGDGAGCMICVAEAVGLVALACL